MNFKGRRVIGSLLIVIVMLLSGISVLDSSVNSISSHSTDISVKHNLTVIPNAEMWMVPVVASYGSLTNDPHTPYLGNISVMVTFSFQNQSRLSTFLSNLSNLNNTQYHRYLTRSQFTSEFSISSAEYSQEVDYFKQFTGVSVKQYADRVSLQIYGHANVIGNAFNTTIVTVSGNTQTHYASSEPQMPLYLASHVSQVTGLSNSKLLVTTGLSRSKRVSAPKVESMVDGGYPAPINSGAVQQIYGSDLQVAYDEQSLLNITYPTNEVIATILWAGTNSSDMPVGPFVPADIYAYYNATMPSYEPHSKVYGVPLNGAVKPGVSASYDVTGANQENTLDLEMVGSTAPGSSIYNVYGPNATFESIDSALNFILNPNSTYSALNHVSVITNSWGGSEFNNTVWYQYLQEAQARGISILASSGDSGDNNASSKYTGSQVEFPSAMAYNNFGVTAVGGTTLTLAQNLHILNQAAWYISSGDSADGGPAGSVGGISKVFSEPSFQLSTEANRILQGAGRGVPDIAAIANNTIVYITIDGTPHYANPYLFWGTSVASPVEAGIIAEMDAVLNHYNQSNLGYLNPLIYNLANKQVSTPSTTATLGYIPTGNYNSSLPTLPFYNVMYGRNHVYNATFGYNLVTGWGSIDAYNLTMYVLNINRSSSLNGLKGVYDKLSLNGLNVTSYLYNSTTGTYSTLNTYFNASIQQNLFLANQLGAPIYWIQNVIYINGSQESGWAVNYTGWVVYPFYGQYPYQTVYKYNFPLGKIIHMPHTFNVTTWISNLTEPMQQTVNFGVNSQIISLPVPGAAYIIDSHNYSYNWQGHTYYNGPYPDNPYTGGLDPQFGLIGGPSGGLGIFGKQTSGTISAYVEPLDINNYIPAITHVYNLSIDETGEVAEFLNFTSVNGNTWSISVNNNSLVQGVMDYSPAQYSETFTESGLPSGTVWYVNLSNGMKSGAITGSSYSFSLTNETYSYTIATTDKTYQPSPASGTFPVNGASVTKSITFSEVKYSATFKESGLPTGTTWYVNLSNGQSFKSTTSTLSFSEPNGSYSYTIATSDKTYSPSLSSGSFTVKGAPVSEPVVTFTEVTYKATFTETGLLPSGSTWYVNLSNGMKSGAITGTSYAFSLTNGSYSYMIATNDKTYSPSPSSGSFTVNGASVPESITFSHVYTVTFTETGLPSGSWYVNLSNGQSFKSTTSTISFTEPNGSYSYTIATSFKIYHANAGQITVNGKNISQPITFSPYTYTVTFTESGLPTGTAWYVNLTNGMKSGAITGTSYTFSLTNGSYSYNIATTNKIYHAAASLFTVNGKNISQPITFSPYTYTVTFTESGLPSGSWYVNLTNGMKSGAITGTSYTFSLTNGSYSYNIATSFKMYEPSPVSGPFLVNGANVTEPTITFSEVKYSVTFKESGLPTGTTWYVNLSNGQSFKSTTSTISFNEPNGTYSYTIGNVSGYTVSPSSGSLTVSGSNATKTITFTVTSTPSNPSNIFSTELYGIIGAVGAVTVIGIAIAIMRKRR